MGNQDFLILGVDCKESKQAKEAKKVLSQKGYGELRGVVFRSVCRGVCSCVVCA